MSYKIEHKVRTALFYKTNIKEEIVFREVALNIIKELPIKKVKELFNLKVIYGTDEALREAHIEENHHKAKTIKNLIREGSTLFTGDVM